MQRELLEFARERNSVRDIPHWRESAGLLAEEGDIRFPLVVEATKTFSDESKEEGRHGASLVL